MTKTISNADDVIDSRDVIERLEELEAERESLAEAVEEYVIGEEEDDEELQRIKDARQELAEWEESYADELRDLKALAEEAEGYAEGWHHGEQLIRDSYFTEYAQELAEDIGAIDRKAEWPNTCSDWEQAASELRMDYTAVEFGGVTYWIR